MKKTIFVMMALFLALGTLGIGAAFAQAETPETPVAPYGQGRMGMGTYGDGDLHAYKLAAFAEKIGMSAEEVTALVEAGTRPHEIALENGVAEADLPAFMLEVHQAALEAAVADGILTQEQADFMIERMQSRGMRGDGLRDGSCNPDGVRPTDGSGFGGRGGMGGGRGGHGGGFFNQQP